LEVDLEVQVRTCRRTRASTRCDGLQRAHLLSAADEHSAEMRIHRRERVPVIDDDDKAERAVPACIDDFAVPRGLDRRTHRYADVDAGVERAVSVDRV